MNDDAEAPSSGGVHRGSSLAAALSYGATGVWVGTRFICAEEAGASKKHQEAVMKAGYDGQRSLPSSTI